MSSGKQKYKIAAVCPRCGKKFTHYDHDPYTGRLPARFFCNECKEDMGYYTGNKPLRLEYDMCECGA